MLVAIIKWNMQIDYFRNLCVGLIFIHVSMFSPFFNFFLFPQILLVPNTSYLLFIPLPSNLYPPHFCLCLNCCVWYIYNFRVISNLLPTNCTIINWAYAPIGQKHGTNKNHSKTKQNNNASSSTFIAVDMVIHSIIVPHTQYCVSFIIRWYCCNYRTSSFYPCLHYTCWSTPLNESLQTRAVEKGVEYIIDWHTQLVIEKKAQHFQ